MPIKHAKIKRAFDIGFSLTAIFFGWPIILFLAILIKCTSKGPSFYGSTRVGIHQKKIVCWKIRTMHLNAEKMLQDILSKDPVSLIEWKTTYKLKQDPRITKIGRYLRKTSLDELPQFWNVLKGDLSLVGPRPLSEEEASLFLEKKLDKIFTIRPGLTGLWQTSGRNNLAYDDRLKLEEEYINKQSFTLDLLLIAKTIPLMIFPKGAF